jgi:hypothetical protein
MEKEREDMEKERVNPYIPKPDPKNTLCLYLYLALKTLTLK